MHPRPLIALAAVLLAVLTMVSAPAHAGVATPAQQPDPTADDGGATGGGEADEVGDDDDELPQPGAPDRAIIPQPNSGRAPTDAGDRGGALQIVVFLAILAGLGGIGALAVRDVRRSRARTDGA